VTLVELTMRCDNCERLDTEHETLERGTEMEVFLRDVERRAYRIALVSVRDPDESLDIVQEAMISLVTSYAARPSEEWRPLFYRILKNRIRDWQRRQSVRRRVMSLFGAGDSDDPDPIQEAPGPAHDNPAAALERGDAMAALAAALRALPRRQREAFTLRNFEGMDVLETALAMGCSDGSVKTHYSRAIAKLRETLGEHWQ
jgi:RNA polymerase sigma-70 factor (ECF subfamily)